MGASGSAPSGDVARVVKLTPDESITDAIGRGHTLATAIADIIDNSLDASAENIRVRFVTDEDRLIAVRIRDDGIGMTPAVLQEAMTLGKQKDRDEADLGHFGIGLKAASLSQALTLTVYSRNYYADPCAMRIRRGSFAGEILDDLAAEDGYEWDSRGPASTGTVVEWKDLETVNRSQLPSERRAWMERTIASLLQALGLTFHRLIQDRGIRITIDTWDLHAGSPGLPRTVEPRDPFHFSLPGHPSYPTMITATTEDGARLDAECFILPPRSESPSAWLLGRNPVEWQGIYVYRNDRLLQAGGWLNVRQDEKRLRLARMRINLTKPLERHLRLRHEKSGVTATPEFTAAFEAASNELGITLDRFREDAAETYRVSNIKKQTLKPAVPIKSGLPDRVVESVREELGERDEDPIRIDWRMLPEGQLFELQHDRHLIRFNLGYRAAIGGDAAALVPTLVYLLLESNFTKSRLSQVTKDQIRALQAIASAAMLSQLDADAYDALADWPRIESTQAQAPARPEIMAGPRPAPPSVELRWALLGQRGQIPQDNQSLSGTADAVVDANDMLATNTSAERPEEGEPLPAPTPTINTRPIQGPETPEEDATRSVAVHRQLPRIDARAGDRDIVAMYRGGSDIDAIAATLVVEPRDVAMRLCALVFDLEGDDIDDHELAAMHGIPYTPEERERIVHMYREGRPIRAIAAHYSRTPFAIAWQILSSPKRIVEIPKNLLRRIDRALAGSPAEDPAEQSFAG